jgi:hypothetical protein
MARAASCALDRKTPLRSGAKRPELPGERDVQPERGARLAGIEHRQRVDLVGVDMRRRHHHRGGVEPAVEDQLANAAVDAGRDAVVVGAEPDAACRCSHSAAFSAAAFALTSSALFTLCSATK